MAKAAFVLPVYNKEAWIAQTLKTITSQTMKDIEIIVWNDGSTDDTMEIVWHFALKDKRIQVLGSAVNQGISKALNQAYKTVTAPYIIVASGDDLYDRLRAQITCDFLDKHPDIDVVYGGFKRVNAQLGLLETKKAVPWKKGEIFKENNQYIPHGFMTLRTSLALKVPYREDLKVGVDHPWIKDLEQSGAKFRALKSYLGLYRWFPSNVSHTERETIYAQDQKDLKERKL